jgi:hypothetical protein
MGGVGLAAAEGRGARAMCRLGREGGRKRERAGEREGGFGPETGQPRGVSFFLFLFSLSYFSFLFLFLLSPFLLNK